MRVLHPSDTTNPLAIHLTTWHQPPTTKSGLIARQPASSAHAAHHLDGVATAPESQHLEVGARLLDSELRLRALHHEGWLYDCWQLIGKLGKLFTSLCNFLDRPEPAEEFMNHDHDHHVCWVCNAFVSRPLCIGRQPTQKQLPHNQNTVRGKPQHVNYAYQNTLAHHIYNGTHFAPFASALCDPMYALSLPLTTTSCSEILLSLVSCMRKFSRSS